MRALYALTTAAALAGFTTVFTPAVAAERCDTNCVGPACSTDCVRQSPAYWGAIFRSGTPFRCVAREPQAATPLPQRRGAR